MQNEQPMHLDECSPPVSRGLEFLTEFYTSREEYRIRDGLAFYLLNKVNSGLVEDFIEQTNTKSFWDDDINEYYQEIYYICLLYEDVGLNWGDNKHLTEAVDRATSYTSQEGKLPFGGLPHGSALRLLLLIMPESERTEEAVSYFESNFDELSTADTALGVLALAEFDSSRYNSTINSGLKNVEEMYENHRGFTDERVSFFFTSLTWIQLVLVRLSSRFDQEKMTSWLENNQHDDGSWGTIDSSQGRVTSTASVLLIFFAIGQGPKAPQDPLEWEIRRLKRHAGEMISFSDDDDQDESLLKKFTDKICTTSPIIYTSIIVLESVIIALLVFFYIPELFWRSTSVLGLIAIISSIITVIVNGPEAYEKLKNRIGG